MQIPSTRPRVALYSHDSIGLGHVRRNLRLAAALSDLDADVLILTGCAESALLDLPARTDIVTVPSLTKDADGYGARHLRMELDELTGLRSRILATTLTAYQPDLLVVDRHARGFLGELEPALVALEDGGTTRCVLGLRDVLDGPEQVAAEWHDTATPAALTRWYDEVWVYGDPSIHDPLARAGMVAPVPTAALGYLAPLPTTSPADADTVVCMMGGGSDGFDLAAGILAAPLPPGLRLHVVTGPQMAAREQTALMAAAERHGRAVVETSTRDSDDLLASAAAVVVMGGYNTTCEVLATDVPALVVPRDQPRIEQVLRARTLAAAGHLDVLEATDLSPAALGWWLAHAARRPRRPRTGIDLDGARGVRRRAAALLPDGRHPSPRADALHDRDDAPTPHLEGTARAAS